MVSHLFHKGLQDYEVFTAGDSVMAAKKIDGMFVIFVKCQTLYFITNACTEKDLPFKMLIIN